MATPAARRRTTTSHAVLGLLSVRPWTTYELAKQVQRSLNWFWPRAERRLYDEPKALVAEGLATASREFTGQRPRTVYGITDAGRQALREWLDLPSAPRAVESEALLKVFFADAGSLDQLVATVAAVEAEARGRLSELAQMAGQGVQRATAFPERQHLSALSMRMQLEQELAVLAWARWATRQLGEWRSTTEPGTWDHAGELARIVEEVSAALGADPADAPDAAG